MKDSMEEVDKLIKETLTKEEAKFYDELDEQNLIGMVGGLFKGKLKWLLILMNVVNIIAFVGFVYCTVQFVNTDITNELIKWGVFGVVLLMMISMLKLFAWMQMDKNALLRETKRLELQISALSNKLP